jgi:hypothetical protein
MSVFGVYWLIRLLQMQKNVAYRGRNNEFTYFTYQSGGTYNCTINAPVRSTAKYFVILDGKEDLLQESNIRVKREATILLAPAITETYYKFTKKDCKTFYIQPWSRKEASTLASVLN